MNRWPPARGWIALFVVLLLGCVFPGEGSFFRPQTHHDLLGSAGVSGILACGMTVVILTGGIDLSVGSILGFAGMVFAMLVLTFEVSWPLAALATLLVGVAVGCVNGSLVAGFRLQPFVVTLAMMAVARGAAKFTPVLAGLSSGQKIQPAVGLGPPIFAWLDGDLHLAGGGAAALGIPVVGAVFLACVLVLWVLLELTGFGRHVFAVGGNEAAARLAGIPVARVKLTAYGLSGFLCGLAAVCQVARMKLGDPEAGATGTGYELKAIAAVVIGGTSLSGGRGGILSTLIGVLIVEYIEKILSLNAVELAVRLMIQGAIILLAVVIQRRP